FVPHETHKGFVKGTIDSLAEWNALWKLDNTETVGGAIRFQKELSPQMAAPENIAPQDFRLQPATPANKDFGTDVDLVAPGPAYERWKATPAYQQWVKDTNQAGATRPFAVLSRDAKAEKPFATLAEAVAAAASGDAIEIRGNGPFVVQPIDLKEKALTLRA